VELHLNGPGLPSRYGAKHKATSMRRLVRVLFNDIELSADVNIVLRTVKWKRQRSNDGTFKAESWHLPRGNKGSHEKCR